MLSRQKLKMLKSLRLIIIHFNFPLEIIILVRLVANLRALLIYWGIVPTMNISNAEWWNRICKRGLFFRFFSGSLHIFFWLPFIFETGLKKKAKGSQPSMQVYAAGNYFSPLFKKDPCGVRRYVSFNLCRRGGQMRCIRNSFL